MNKNTLALLNRIRTDALIRTADSPHQLAVYIGKYFRQTVSDVEASSLFKAIQTQVAKIKAARKAKKQAEPELALA